MNARERLARARTRAAIRWLKTKGLVVYPKGATVIGSGTLVKVDAAVYLIVDGGVVDIANATIGTVEVRSGTMTGNGADVGTVAITRTYRGTLGTPDSLKPTP